MKIICCVLLLGGITNATTYNAASCHYADFVTAINSASDGDTVQGPPAGGSDPSWTTRLNITKSLIINGNGCNIRLSGTDFMRMISTNASVHPRITNFTISGSNNSGLAAIWVDGNNPNFRVDHITFNFTSVNKRAIAVDYGTNTQYSVPTYGVIDHNTFNYTGGSPMILINGVNDAWFDDANWGTANAMYIENNTFVYNTGAAFTSTQSVVDSEEGARVVVRYNDITDGYIAHHDTGSTPGARGTRIFEHYGNTFHTDTTGFTGAMGYRGGNGMDFNNQVPIDAGGNNGFQYALGTEIKRLTCESTSQCGVPMDFGTRNPDTHAVCSSFRGWCSVTGTPTNQVCSASSDCTIGGGDTCNFTAPPNNAACGTSLTGQGYVRIANIDGLGSPTGYPSRDQNGVGKDDPTTHAQTAAAEPSYSWNNTDSNNGNALITGSAAVNTGGSSNYILADREYYRQVVSFTGASGVGVGTLASRPGTCTPKVGYWATDQGIWNQSGSGGQGELFVCTATNTWTLYYTPYTYPHPLQGGGGAQARPTGLSAVIQ